MGKLRIVAGTLLLVAVPAMAALGGCNAAEEPGDGASTSQSRLLLASDSTVSLLGIDKWRIGEENGHPRTDGLDPEGAPLHTLKHDGAGGVELCSTTPTSGCVALDRDGKVVRGDAARAAQLTTVQAQLAQDMLTTVDTKADDAFSSSYYAEVGCRPGTWNSVRSANAPEGICPVGINERGSIWSSRSAAANRTADLLCTVVGSSAVDNGRALERACGFAVGSDGWFGRVAQIEHERETRGLHSSGAIRSCTLSLAERVLNTRAGWNNKCGAVADAGYTSYEPPANSPVDNGFNEVAGLERCQYLVSGSDERQRCVSCGVSACRVTPRTGQLQFRPSPGYGGLVFVDGTPTDAGALYSGCYVTSTGLYVCS